MKIPESTTHVWTPAYSNPRVGWYLRRAFYRKREEQWESYSTVSKEWSPSLNEREWFTVEHADGYFVSLETFENPSFQAKEEK